MNFKVRIDQYKKVLLSLSLFKKHAEAIKHLMYKINQLFNEPEMIFIQQGDKSNKHIYFTG